MRNLKRALSLAMASVMLLGMMVVGTGAASYTDVTSKDNQEAIEVLKTVAIMTGDENGNFNPAKNVTRNEMAVVMANLLDYNVAQYVGTAPFKDVPTWAEPYVAACYTHGIVAGTSATTYGGDQTVTAAQAALMLMKALGYFQYASDFGDDWQLATIRQGSRIDLFKNVSASVKEPMTRNDVAQIVLNTLKSTMVEPDDNTINVTTPDATVQAGNIKYWQIINADTRIYNSIKNDTGNSMTGVTGPTVELGEKLYKGNLKMDDNTSDAFGRPGTQWTYKAENIGTFSIAPDATYTAKLSKGAFHTLLGKDVIRDYNISFFIDGDEQTTTGTGDAFSSTYVLSGSSSAACNSGKGVLTEVFIDTDDKLVTVCVTNTFVAQATADYNESKEALNVDVLTAPAGFTDNSLDGKDFDLTDYKDEDYVLYTASTADNGTTWTVESVAKAETMSGKVDNYSVTNYVTLDGTKYEYAAKIEGADPSTPTDSAATDYVVGDTASIVTDAYGYVIYVDDASISAGNYVYIAATAAESSLVTKTIADAYFGDGTNEAITVKAMSAANGNPIVPGSSRDTTNAGWYSYSKNSKGEYTLKKAVTSGTSAVVTKIENNKAAFATGAGITGNSTTVFIVNDKNDTVTVYTGIAQLPNMTPNAGNMTVSYMKSKDDSAKAASLVFIDASNASVKNSANSSLLYTLKRDSTYIDNTDHENVYTWKVILDGKETKVDTKETWTAGVLYEDFTIDNKGYYEKGTAFAADPDQFTDALAGHTIGYSDGLLTIGSRTVVVSDTQIVLVMAPTTKGSGALSTVIMKDNNADYELATPSARALANLFKDYGVTGTSYVYYNDKSKSDLATKIYVVVTDATVATAPVIGTQPAAATTVNAGTISGTLAVAATNGGSGTLSYLWYQDGVALASGTGYNTNTLTIPTTLTAGVYKFTCEVTNTQADNTVSKLTSSVATVTVKPAAPTYSAGSVAGDVSDKTITITNSTNLPVGTYNLYLKSAPTVSIAQVKLDTAGTTLSFTGVEGLTTSSTDFQISVTINGQTSVNSADIAITPIA